MADSAIDRAKQAVRHRVWDAMEREGVSLPPGAQGRIPNFVGADLAAERLADLAAWRSASVVKSNPDWAQLPVRLRALTDGKLLYMAVPRLATVKPFYLLDPAELPQPFDAAVSSDGAAEAAPKVGLDEMRPVDLVVAGSVAVNPAGVRIGKGAGYSDIEVALLIEAGLIGQNTIIVTTVHPVQVLDEDLPEADHDFRVDIAVTSADVLICDRSRRPTGILFEQLSDDVRRAIPILRGIR